MNMRGAFNDGVSSELERNLPPNGAQTIDWTLRQGVGGEMRSIPAVPCVLLAATYQSQFFFNIKKDDSARHHTHTHTPHAFTLTLPSEGLPSPLKQELSCGEPGTTRSGARTSVKAEFDPLLVESVARVVTRLSPSAGGASGNKRVCNKGIPSLCCSSFSLA